MTTTTTTAPRSILKPGGASATKATAASAAPANGNSAHGGSGKLSASSVPPFKCDLRFQNRLPDIPFDPKFFPVPLPKNFLVNYSRHSTLERHHKWRVHVDAPQTTEDQLVDMLGEEEYGRGLLDADGGGSMMHPADVRILRLEGDEKRARHASNMEEKSWLQKPVYLQTIEKIAARVAADEYDLDEQARREAALALASASQNSAADEAPLSKEEQIAEEFRTAQDVASFPPHPSGAQVRRVYRVLPNTALRQRHMLMVRFHPAGEPLGEGKEPDDEWRNARGVLIKRAERKRAGARPGPRAGPNASYNPLTLLLPRALDKDDDEDDDLFADEDAEAKPKYDEKAVAVVRDYNVVVSTDPTEGRRLAIILSRDPADGSRGVAAFTELQRQSLKLSRSRKSHAMETNVALELE